MPVPTLEEIARELNTQRGQGKVAHLLDMDEGEWSRVLSGQKGMKLEKYDLLLELAGYAIAPLSFNRIHWNMVNMLLDIIQSMRVEYNIRVEVLPEDKKELLGEK